MTITNISIGGVPLGDEAEVRALFRDIADATEEDFPEVLRAFVKRLRTGSMWNAAVAVRLEADARMRQEERTAAFEAAEAAERRAATPAEIAANDAIETDELRRKIQRGFDESLRTQFPS